MIKPERIVRIRLLKVRKDINDKFWFELFEAEFGSSLAENLLGTLNASLEGQVYKGPLSKVHLKIYRQRLSL